MIYIALLVLFIDLLTKYLVQTNMVLNQSIPILEPVFHVTYILNPGAAFGLFAHKTSFFIFVTSIVILAIAFGYKKIKEQSLLVRISLGMIAGGAVGNLVDRIRYGKVVDFLDFRIWPVFNLADTAIVIGVGLLVLEILQKKE